MTPLTVERNCWWPTNFERRRREKTRKYVGVVRARLLQSAFIANGIDSPVRAEKVLYPEIEPESFSDLRPKWVDRYWNGDRAVGSRTLLRSERALPGSTLGLCAPFFDLLGFRGRWTLPLIHKHLRRLGNPAHAELFFESGSELSKVYGRRQRSLVDLRHLASSLCPIDRLAMWIALFYERQLLGDRDECLQLKWELEDCYENVREAFPRSVRAPLGEALWWGVSAVELGNDVIERNLESYLNRLEKAYDDFANTSMEAAQRTEKFRNRIHLTTIDALHVVSVAMKLDAYR